jgi:cyclophilin family peptidyl-prolyl cis-trans isomerase/protein-disulfide isomerase
MRKLWAPIILLSMLLSSCNVMSAARPTVTVVASSTPAATAITTATAEPTSTPATAPGECKVSSQTIFNQKSADAATYAPISSSDFIEGPDTAVMTLIEYADFTCPYCSQAAPEIEKFMKAYPNDVRLVYRNLPVGHTLSQLSIQAADAASLQGKFWEMHDLLFDTTTWSTWDALSTTDFQAWIIKQAATIPGLDVSKFTKDLTSDAVVKMVSDEENAAIASSINSTPSVFVLMDGKLFFTPSDGVTSYYALSTIFKLWKFENGQQYTSCPPNTIDTSKTYTATLKTTKGDIVINLFASKAPVTVNSFVFLAKNGWFDNAPFFRVIDSFVAQAGDPTGTGYGAPGYEFGDEIDSSLNFDQAGMVGMANAGPGTNGSQFFITLASVASLDGKYTVFGQVTQGLDVLQKITRRDPSSEQSPADPDLIQSVTIDVH